MLWLSHPGVVAQTHYDTQHNFFVHLQGEKTIHLFPPETELYSYPNIHRAYRQSQIFFETNLNDSRELNKSGKSSKYPRAEDSKAIEVNLKRGDLLYIPPYWQHRVMSNTLALSLSVLSPSLVETALAEAYWQAVPFGSFKASLLYRTAAATHYLRLVLSGNDVAIALAAAAPQPGEVEEGDIERGGSGASSGDLVTRSFARSLYHTRFSSLFPLEVLQEQKYPPVAIPTADVAGSKRGRMGAHRLDKAAGGGTEAASDSVTDGVTATGSGPGAGHSGSSSTTSNFDSSSDSSPSTQAPPAKLAQSPGPAVPLCANLLSFEMAQAFAAAGDKFEGAAQQINKLLSEVRTSTGVKNTFLRDYVEQISRWAVGPDNTARFIYECLGELTL